MVANSFKDTVSVIWNRSSDLNPWQMVGSSLPLLEWEVIDKQREMITVHVVMDQVGDISINSSLA